MASAAVHPATRRPARRDAVRSRRAVDRLLALVCFPLVALLTLAPGGLGEPDGGAGSPVPGVLFRLFPGLLEEGSRGPLAAVDHWAVAACTFVLVPGAVAVAVMRRRDRPEWLLALSAVLLLLIGNIVPIAVALYSFAAWFDDRRQLAAWTAAALAALTAALWGAAPAWSVFTMVLVAVVVPLCLGLWMSTRRRLVETLRERAERLEREHQLLAERATIAERTRIAREMHDVVAHRVSLIVLHAGGIELSAEDPELARSAERIGGIGREALSELRDLLGVLHDGDEVPLAPQSVLADVDRLTQDWEATGTPIQVTRTGKIRELPARTERTAYRVVQEALTNAAKHATGSTVRIRIDYRPAAVMITVVNDLVTPPAAASLPESGHGLTGLRERVALAGGELIAGPRPDGAWELRATVPATTAADGLAPDGPSGEETNE